MVPPAAALGAALCLLQTGSAHAGGESDLVSIIFPPIKGLDYAIGPQNKKEIIIMKKNGSKEKVQLSAKESLFNKNIKVLNWL